MKFMGSKLSLPHLTPLGNPASALNVYFSIHAAVGGEAQSIFLIEVVGWNDGWMSRWMGGWMNEWMNGWINVKTF